MAGHSHWANIKHKKAAIDKKRGKMWGKIAKKIMVAAKGGPDPRDNLALRYIIDEAKAANMPKNTIENAIAKGSGGAGGEGFEEIVYEGYGPGGVAVLVEVLTDNRNRTAGELRNIFERNGGSLGTSGSVAFQFTKQGVIAIRTDAVSEDRLMELALEAGAQDVREEGEVFVVFTQPAEFEPVKNALGAASIATESAEIGNQAQNTVELGEDEARRILKLIDALEDNDDVQNVSHNADIPEAALQEA
jgi:YebC/PmpR family DNA-binding regulatory protein